MGCWLSRSDCKQCLGKCSPDDGMKDYLAPLIPTDETSENWRFEVIHDMISDKKNLSYRGSQFNSDDAWVIGMYKTDTEFDDIIFEFLICYNRDGKEKYYAKLKVEMHECAFLDSSKKTKSSNMNSIKNEFLKKWEKEFTNKGWKKTKESGKRPPHNSISVLKFEGEFEEDLKLLRNVLISAAKSIDKHNWL
jgi:hypothetical protein